MDRNPGLKMLEGEMQKLLKIEERLHERVIGQDEAIDAVAMPYGGRVSGLADPNRPIGSFIFLGPTGVGKTELAKALAQTFSTTSMRWSASTCPNIWRSMPWLV